MHPAVHPDLDLKSDELMAMFFLRFFRQHRHAPSFPRVRGWRDGGVSPPITTPEAILGLSKNRPLVYLALLDGV
jgi:hypothetical protein